METVDELDTGVADAPDDAGSLCIQPCGYLLELSPDWIVLRASENIHHLLRESHVTLIDEPLGKFVHSQALHDLRNLFSRLSATTGIGRAYAVRLTEDPDLVDIAFQLREGRVLLEAVPSAGSFGECFGSVGGLIAGLSNAPGQALLDGGARRMRALTGYDRVTLSWAQERAESSRGAFAGPAETAGADLPMLIVDTRADGVHLFPRETDESSAHEALMRAPAEAARQKLRDRGIRAMLRVPFTANGAECEFCCESRTALEPSFEVHAAAELFAQMFALRLELDRLESGG
jgi:PAS fold